MTFDPKSKVVREALAAGQADELCQLLAERWAGSLTPGEIFFLRGWWQDQRLFLSLTLSKPEREEALVLEVQLDRADFAAEDEALALGCDALEALLGEYLEADRELFFPIEWTESTFQGKELGHRGSFHNYRLEREAEEWLSKAGALPGPDDEGEPGD